jgi:hypothetical protein
MTRRNLAYATAGVAGVLAVAAVVASALALARGSGEGLTAPARSRAFAWTGSRSIPPSWSWLRLPGSAVRLPLPDGWVPARGDAGTRTAELKRRPGEIVGYLNATPREGAETLANWPAFRPGHNREEGDRDVRLLASARDVRFRAATGSCVLDAYRTISGARYREIACLVAGRSASAVVVGAAPPRLWAAEAPVLERAVAGFET